MKLFLYRCGHCRAFAPYYREFASLVSTWGEITRVSAINCADSFNAQVCRDNGVAYFPMIKVTPLLLNPSKQNRNFSISLGIHQVTMMEFY